MHVTGSGPFDGLSEVCRTIWREDGMRGFYRGAQPLGTEMGALCMPAANALHLRTAKLQS
jgi:hypothetical protein